MSERYRCRLMRATVLATVAAIAGGALAQETTAPPRIEIVRPLIDLGELERGIKVDVTFDVRNTGGQPLHLLDVKPG